MRASEETLSRQDPALVSAITGGEPRTKPKALQGDAGYGPVALADLVKWLGIKPILAPRSEKCALAARTVPTNCQRRDSK